MKIKWKPFILCIAIPLIIGGLSGIISSSSMDQFAQLNQPAFSPPGWLFPVVWTILFLLMGLASYLVIVSDRTNKLIIPAITVYSVQLIFNFFWPIWFFNLGLYSFAFIWLVILWILILITIILFYQISKPAAYLMIPYLLWVTFAGYLNLGVALLN